MMKNSFVLFTEIIDVVEALTNEQKGMLFQAILDYESGKDPDLSDQVIRVAFTPIKQNLDRCAEKWEEERQKRSDAGKRGMASRWKDHKPITKDNNVIPAITKDNSVIPVITNDNKALQDITKITVNVNEDVNVNVNDKDKVVNYQLIADMFNNTCVSFPKVTTLSDSRRRAIRARLRKYSVEDLKKAFLMAEASDFLKGANNRNWSANFDWIMNDANLAKILDGNYSSKGSKIEMDQNFRNFLSSNEVVDFGNMGG